MKYTPLKDGPGDFKWSENSDGLNTGIERQFTCSSTVVSYM